MLYLLFRLVILLGMQMRLTSSLDLVTLQV